MTTWWPIANARQAYMFEVVFHVTSMIESRKRVWYAKFVREIHDIVESECESVIRDLKAWV